MRLKLPVVLFLLATLACTSTVSAQENEALLVQEDLVRIGKLGWIAPSFKVPTVKETALLVHPEDKGPGAMLLRRLAAQGRAGGFEGIVYENRDRGHSTLPHEQFPQLVFLKFGPELRKQRLDYGLAGSIILPGIVLGNSSTALRKGPYARSQARVAMTSPGGPERAYLTYSNNHLYIYPEHHDHDERDLFPANWPYMVVTQGSSGSDRPFLRAFALTLAALPEDTRRFLQDKHLVAPTLQMILRRSQSKVYSRKAYLSGLAHPTVFSDEQLAPERMVSLASSLRPKDIPPMVRLTVESEEFSDAAGLAGLSERLLETPSAIARIWRAPDYRREMTISAENTVGPNSRKLKFNWVLLRGDREKVRIEPLDEDGIRARIQIDWHDQRRIERTSARVTDRVDIGVFASNGVHDSAPAIVSISFPTHQTRVYDHPDRDGNKKLVSVDYSQFVSDGYYDPLIHWSADWKDEFEYDDKGQMDTWTRIWPDKTVTLLSPESPGANVFPGYEITNSQKRPYLVTKQPID